MYCKKCGKWVEDNAMFCGYCGEQQYAADNPQGTSQGMAGQTSFATIGENRTAAANSGSGTYEVRENILLGTVGAILGSLIGVAVMVILDQLGYVAAISGVVLAVCSLKGYEILGKKISGVSIVISLLVIIAMIYAGTMLSWGIAFYSAYRDYGDVNLLMCIRALPSLFELDAELLGDFHESLAMQYGFAALGAFSIIFNAFRRRK